MLDYAVKLTLAPAKIEHCDVVRLKEGDFNDTAIMIRLYWIYVRLQPITTMLTVWPMDWVWNWRTNGKEN